MTQGVPASTRIAEAHARRRLRHTGVVRAKIVTGLLGVAFVFGVLAGCYAPGA